MIKPNLVLFTRTIFYPKIYNIMRLHQWDGITHFIV